MFEFKYYNNTIVIEHVTTDKQLDDIFTKTFDYPDLLPYENPQEFALLILL